MENLFDKLKKQNLAEVTRMIAHGYDVMDVVHNEIPLSVWYVDEDDGSFEVVAVYCEGIDIRDIISDQDLKEIDQIVYKRHRSVTPC